MIVDYYGNKCLNKNMIKKKHVKRFYQMYSKPGFLVADRKGTAHAALVKLAACCGLKESTLSDLSTSEIARAMEVKAPQVAKKRGPVGKKVRELESKGSSILIQ